MLTIAANMALADATRIVTPMMRFLSDWTIKTPSDRPWTSLVHSPLAWMLTAIIVVYLRFMKGIFLFSEDSCVKMEGPKYLWVGEGERWSVAV
jgi:hypothetical protein